MGFMLQFAAFLTICWLFRGAVTHANQSEDKVLNSKHSNRNGPDAEDFYFDEHKANDDNVKTGRAVPHSAWSKEDKEQTQKVENETGGQFNNEFSLKNALSYFINMIQELKKDILGLKEMASLKNIKDSTKSGDNSEDNMKVNKRYGNNDAPKPDSSTKTNEFYKENQKLKSNYITDYYQKNSITFVDDELEISSDESDDSSHKPNEGGRKHGVNKNEDDGCIFECSKMDKKHNKYSSGHTTVIPISHTKKPEESGREFDDTQNNAKGKSFKESDRKPSKMEQSNSKMAAEETENTPTLKMGICRKKNNNNHNNLNDKNEHTEKPLKSTECITTRSPQNENFNKAKSEIPKENKGTDNLSKMTSASPEARNSEKKLEKEGDSDFDSQSGIPQQSTTFSSQSSKDVLHPENLENKQDEESEGMSSKKPIYKKLQEQNTSLKQDDQEQSQNNEKSLNNDDRPNKYTTVSLQEVRGEIPNQAMNTDAEIKGNPNESKDKRLNVDSSHTTVPYSKNEQNSITTGEKSSNSFATGTTIPPIKSRNMNVDDSNKDSSNNLNGHKGANGNEKPAANQEGKDYSETLRNAESKQPQQFNNDSEQEKTSKNNELNYSNSEYNKENPGGKKGANGSEKLAANLHRKNYSETQRNTDTKQSQQLKDDSMPEKTSKNSELNYSKGENKNKEKDDNLATMATNDHPPSQYSNSEIQNHEVEESDKPQEEQKNNKRDEMFETSPDQEYDFEEYNEDFDISDELTNTEMDEDVNQNEEAELIINNGNEMNEDEIDADNIATVSKNESQMSRHTGYVMEEKPQEQYNTFLEYFYKNSNNSLFQALQNQSNNTR